MIWGAYDQFLLLSGNSSLIKFDSHNITAKWVVIKGEALLTAGYTIVLVISHTPTKCIHSQISFHRKHEIIEQSGI